MLRDDPVEELVVPAVQPLHPGYHPLGVEPVQPRDEVADVELPRQPHQLHHHLLELPGALPATVLLEHPPPHGGPGQRVGGADVHGVAQVDRRIAARAERVHQEPHLALPYPPEVVERLGAEEVDGAELAEHTPAGAVWREHEVLVVVGDVLGAGVGRPVTEDGVVRAEQLGSDGRGGGDDDVHGAEAEAEERAVDLGQRVQRVVRLRAQLGQVAEDRPAAGTGRQGLPPRLLEVEEEED